MNCWQIQLLMDIIGMNTRLEEINSLINRFEPYLRSAVQLFVRRNLPSYAWNTQSKQPREFWISFYGIPILNRLRELTCAKVGQLLNVSGTVTRTSEVRPELLSGCFQCLDCFTELKNIEQQYKYTQV